MLGFAQELIDTALDFLHDDAESLRCSSLVARAWVSTPRHHLFSRTAINCFYNSRTTIWDNAHSFLALCGSQHCTILTAIHSVVLNIKNFGNEDLLGSVIDVLARATLKEVWFLDWTSPLHPPISAAWIAARLPHQLQKLSYNCMNRAHASEDVFFLATSFPTLGSLVVHAEAGISLRNPTLSFPPLPCATNLGNLHTLTLRLTNHHLEQAVWWFQAAGLRLETLDIEILHYFHNGWGQTTSLNAFLNANANRLQHFHLRVAYQHNPDIGDDEYYLHRVSDGQVDLSQLTNLRSLHLRTHDIDAVCITLDSLPKELPCLKTVVIDIVPWPFGDDDVGCPCDPSSLFGRFSRTMSGTQFTQLTKFGILIPDLFEEDGVEVFRTVNSCFPQWNQSGIIQVGFTDTSEHQVDSWHTVRDLMYGSH